MAKGSIDYHKKIEQMLMKMPDFVSDFIYNFGQVEKTATKFQYCRDIRDFLNFMVNFMPEHDGKSIRELTRDDIAGVEPLYINRYLTMLSGKGDSGLKLSTVKRRRASLSSMYGFFVVNGKMNANPVASTRPIRLPEKSLIYLNNDDIPDLICDFKDTTSATFIISFRDDQLDSIIFYRSGGIQYYEREGLIYNSCNSEEGIFDELACLGDEGFQDLGKGFRYNDSHKSPEHAQFYWNDEEVSEEEYNNMINKIDPQKSKKWNTYSEEFKNNNYSRDEILQYLREN